MHEDLTEKLRINGEILQDLLSDNDKWSQFNEELKRLETLFKNIDSMFDSKTFGDSSLEEKQHTLEVEKYFII
jgi:hypothetical protein